MKGAERKLFNWYSFILVLAILFLSGCNFALEDKTVPQWTVSSALKDMDAQNGRVYELDTITRQCLSRIEILIEESYSLPHPDKEDFFRLSSEIQAEINYLMRHHNLGGVISREFFKLLQPLIEEARNLRRNNLEEAMEAREEVRRLLQKGREVFV